jgi:5-bromo-4-chloroindolyl phosphate hydrolysis protein
MKTIVRKSMIPLYATAVTWVLYALFFPLYQVKHFIIAAIAAAVVGLIARALCKDVVEEVPEKEPEPEVTGNEELDKMLADGRAALAELRRLDDNIADEKISADIVHLESVCNRIFEQVKAEPKKLPQIRKFMSYYLPTTLKLLKAYDQVSSQGVEGENISATKGKVAGIMDSIVAAFDKQLDSLFGDQALDISTDITVLENMMAREGFSEDMIHKTQQPNQPASSDTDDDTGEGITLEL